MKRTNPENAPATGPALRPRWQTLLFACTGLPLLIFVLTRWPGFDGLYGQDAYAYLAYALGPLAEALETGNPLPPFFWPPGYPLAIYMASVAAGSGARAGQFVALIAGVLVPIFTALLAHDAGRSVEDPAREKIHAAAWVAPAAAGLMAGMLPQLWQSSAVVMADTTGLAAATFGVWCLIRYRLAARYIPHGGPSKARSAALPWILLAAASISFAVLSRWGFALVAIPCAIYALAVWRGMPRLRAVRDFALCLVTAIIILYPVLVPAFLEVFGPEQVGGQFVGDLRVYSWSPANALRRAFVTTDGFQQYRLPNGLYYALVPGHRFYFTPLGALFLLPGLHVIWRRRTPNMLLLIAWAAVIYSFHAGAPWQNFRFALAYLPPLAVTAGLGVGSLWRRAPVRYRWAIGSWFLGSLVIMAAGGISLTDSFIERKERSFEIMSRVEDRLPPDGTLITFGLTGAYQHYFDRNVLELFTLRAEDHVPAIDRGESYYLLADLENIQTQWEGQTPGQNLSYFESNTTIVPLGEYPPYTLLRLEP